MSSCEDNEPILRHDSVRNLSNPAEYGLLDGKCIETNLRRKLLFFFMNPIEKWQARRKFPCKLFIQLIKILLVTLQLFLFAHSRYNHVNYAWDNRITFSHLFLKGWDTTREVNSYPPSLGPLALYNKDAFYQTIDFAFNGYLNVSDAIGPYSYASEDNKVIPPILCLYQYKEGIIYGFNESFTFNSEIEQKCCELIKPDSTPFPFSISDHMNGFNISFSSLVRVTIDFSLKTVNFKASGPLSQPDCYKFKIQITFDNEDMDGQMVLSLDAEPIRLDCQGDINYITENKIDNILRSILNLLVIFICTLSFILCSRAIYRAQLLKLETVRFFKNFYKKELGSEERWQFLNVWYVMIIINDLLIIIGSAVKEEIERKQFVGDQWNLCSLFLGIGNLLVWFGVLRYLGFFKTYNVVILTLKKAFPKVIRFLLCAVLIYAGFTFCGWLVLGPYHIKFRTLAGTSECLFALINGDDMYATFSIMTVKSSTLWWFSRIYLYSFISLYIYVVLSLFISIIMDAYDTIKLYYKEGFPRNDLQIFIADGAEEIFQSPDENSPASLPLRSRRSQIFSEFLCCKTRIGTLIFGKRRNDVETCGTI